MANFTQDTTIGIATAGQPTLFMPNTRVWAGGDGTTFSSTEDVRIDGGVTLTSREATMVIQNGLWEHGRASTGTYDFRNTVLDMHGMPANASGSDNLTFRDVTILSTGQTGQTTWGNWNSTASVYTIDGLNLWFNHVVGDNTLATCHFFIINTTGTYDNISLWNGTEGAGILGGTIGFSNFIVAGLTSGPIGSELAFSGTNTSPGSGARILYRMAVGAGNFSQLLSYDYRAIEGVTGRWIFGHDTGGTTWQINPLEGDPTTGGATGSVSFASPFGGAAATLNRVLVQRPATNSGDIKFVNGQAGVMYTIPQTLANTAAGSPQVVTGNIITHEGATVPADAGIGFLDSTITNASNASTAIVALTNKTYRTYSWQQADWGTDRVINPTNPGATDAQVQEDRNSGVYPQVDATGILTTIDINEVDDAITAGFDTYADAIAAGTGLHRLGGAQNPRDVLASLKAVHYGGVTTTHVDLPYTVDGPKGIIDANITLSGTATAAPSITGNRTIPVGSLSVATVESILEIEAADPAVPGASRSITVVGDILNNTANKAALTASGAFSTLSSVNNMTITGDTLSITGSSTNSTLTGTGSNASTVGALSEVTTVTTVGDLTIGNSSASTASTQGALTLPNMFIGTGSTLTGVGITNFNSGTIVTGTTSRLVDFNATNTGAVITIPTNYVITGNLTGNWTFDGDYTIEGDATISGNITINDGSTVTISGLNAGFGAVPSFEDGPLGITIILDEGASQNSAFNGGTITDPDVNVESNPYDVTINNTGVGDLYFRILKVVPGNNTAAVLDTDYALLGGGDWTASNSLPSGGTGVIRITETQIGAENWLLYVAGQSLEDTRVPLTYSLNDPIVNPAIDPGYSTAGIPSTYADWTIATDEVQFLTANIPNAIPAGTAIELDIDPELGTSQPLTDFTVYGSVPAGTTVTAVGGVAGAYTVTLSANAQAGDNIFITYPGNSNFQFGINIPSGSVLTTPSVLNNAIGTFKSNQDYADYIAFTDDVDPAETTWESKGIQFIDREDTRLYYEGPGDAQFILEQTDVGENPDGYRTGFLDTSNGDWDGMPVISSGTTVRAIPNLDQLQSTGQTAVRFKMDVGGDDRFVTVDTWNTLIDNRNNAFGAFDRFYTNANWGPTATAWDSAATNNVRHLEFRLERTDTEAFPDGIFRVVGWTTNNITYTNIDTTEATGVDAAAGTIVTGLALEWDYTDFSLADQITYGLRPDINTVDSTIFYRTDSFFGAGTNTASYHPITFSTVVQLPATGVPPIRTFINVTLGTSANEIQSNGFRGLIVDPADTTITAGSINLDTTNTAGVNNWNAAFVNGLEGSFTPAGGTATAVDAGIVSATPPEVDYLLIRAQAEQALANFGAATETNVDEVETKIDAIDGDLSTIDGKVDNAQGVIDINNKRLRSINAGDNNKIPIRRAYNAATYPGTE